MAKDIYAAFRTDPKVEAEGVWQDYGEFRVRLARAGGANKRYAKVMERLMRPYQRAIKSETLPAETGNRIVKEAFAEAIITGWETKVGEPPEGNQTDTRQFAPGVKSPATGEILPPTKDSYMRAFDELPELFNDFQSEAMKLAVYRADVLEANAGN